MNDELRTLSLGETIDAAFDLYKENFALFVGVIAIIHIPTSIALQVFTYSLKLEQTFGGQGPKTDEQFGQFFTAMGILAVVMLGYTALYVMQSAVLAIAAGDRFLGRKTSITAAYLKFGTVFPQLCGSWLMISAVLLVVGIVTLWASALAITLLIGALGVSGAPLSDVATFLVGMGVILSPCAVLIAIGIWLATFINQVIAFEGQGATNAIMRNASLVRGGFGRVLAMVLLLIVLWSALAISIQSSVLFVLRLSVFSWVHIETVAQRIVEGTCASVISLCLQPFVAIALTVLYFDRRVRRDGMDIALLSSKLRLPPAETTVHAT